MIPKIIHYCWLSNEAFPESIQSCINSWKKHMPEYDFILWDTKRFDINSNLYVKQAYESKKYAFASDYIRLYALYMYGGIYLDSDIMVFKSFDELLDHEAFTGFETDEKIAAWIFASEKGNPLFKELLEYYEQRKFLFPNGSFDTTPNVVPVTSTLYRHGLRGNGAMQTLDHITVFPRTYFCPHIPYGDYPDCYSENTYAQHLFNGAWISPEERKLISQKHSIEKQYGKIVGLVFYGIQILRKEGIHPFIQKLKVHIQEQQQERIKK